MNNSNDVFITSGVTISGQYDSYPDNLTITLPTPLDTINIDSMCISSGGTYTISNNLTSATIGTVDITGSSFNWITGTPFEDSFPDWDDFQAMCREYPGLEKTFEHLKAFYKLCKDDWEAKKKGEND